MMAPTERRQLMPPRIPALREAVQENNEVIARTAFGIMQANVTNVRETVFDGKLALRLHWDNPDRRAESALKSESLCFLVRNVNLHPEESGGKCLSLRISHQR